jgi:hypothetical protein
MPRKKTSALEKSSESPIEFARSYYEHQYDRMAKLEEQRLTFTNIVVTLTVLAFTLVISNLKAITQIGGFGILVLVIALNFFATIYTWRTLQYVRIHRKRAKMVLEEYAQEIYRIDDDESLPHIGSRFGLAKTQMLVHVTLIVFAIVLISLSLFSALVK